MCFCAVPSSGGQCPPPPWVCAWVACSFRFLRFARCAPPALSCPLAHPPAVSDGHQRTSHTAKFYHCSTALPSIALFMGIIVILLGLKPNFLTDFLTDFRTFALHRSSCRLALCVFTLALCVFWHDVANIAISLKTFAELRHKSLPAMPSACSEVLLCPILGCCTSVFDRFCNECNDVTKKRYFCKLLGG